MKKTGVIILFILFSCTQIGSIVWYYCKPLIHSISAERQRRKAASDTANLLHLNIDKITYSNLKVENEDEIRWHGVLYDIEKISITNSDVNLLLRKDEAETNWLHYYSVVNNLLKKTNSPQREVTTGLWKWFFQIYITAEKIWNTDIIPADTVLIPTHYITFLPLSPFLPSCGQPPDVA